jgi:[acyl-carrier-protein] S-malonyltransferase
MSKRALIFPGQGAQAVGMGKDICASHEAARSVFERAHAVLGWDLAKLCFEGPASELEKTDVQQPAIFVTSVALWEAYRAAGGPADDFARAGGLSLGEYTALYAGEAFDFEDGLRLVRRRGELMQAAAEASPSGMVSLVGADEVTARALCEAAREQDVLAPANFNCPGQIVIAGHRGACERAVSMAERHDCRAIPLAVAGAFHTPLMQSAADGLHAELDQVEIRPPRLPVVANVDASYHQDPAGIRDSLVRQVTHPVRWQRCVERMISDGVTQFVEVGPGRVLTGMMRKIERRMPTVNISTADTLSAALPQEAASD